MIKRKIKKIFLVLPPYTIPASMPRRAQAPLGISYLGAYLERHGYEVELCDSLIEGFDHSEYLYGDFIRYGLTIAQIKARIQKFQPDVVGVSCLFTIMAQSAYEICRITKELNPDIVTIMGGAHPSSMTEDVLSQGCIDFVVPGEGEITLLKLLGAIQNGQNLRYIQGIAFLQNGHVQRTPVSDFLMNLDELPMPARHLLPMDEYFKKNRPHGTATKYDHSTPIITSRGCPAKCTFCSIHTVWGREFRGRSGKNVVEELMHLKEKYRVKEIQIEDDNLTYSKPRAHELLDRIIEADLGLSFTTPNGIAAWVMDKPLLEKLKKAGFYRLTFAVESGNEQVLHDLVRKPLRLKTIREIVPLARSIGFEIDTFWVVGFPGETKAQINDTINFANSLDVDNIKFFIATPYPGTELYKIAKEKGYLNPNFDFLNGLTSTKGQISTPEFTSLELESIVARASFKTQFTIMRRRPIRYLKSFVRDYFIKEPSAVLRYTARAIRASIGHAA